MIIKIKSRKDNNFRQIIGYLHKELDRGDLFTYVHNIDDIAPDDQEGMIAAFRENDQYRTRRKNGVSFYHDILSFAPEDAVAIRADLDLLRDITEQYIALRSPNALVVARPHIEENHIHIHLIVSASERESNQSVRISKAKLEDIKQQIRAYQRQHYPQLLHSFQKDKMPISENAYSHETWQMAKRGVIQDKKLRLKQLIIVALQKADTQESLTHLLKLEGISVYHRGGKLAGIVWRNKRYRFSTLIKNETEQEHHLKIEQLKQQESILEKADNDKMRIFENLKTPWQQIQQDLEQMEQQRIRNKTLRQQQQDLDLSNDFDNFS